MARAIRRAIVGSIALAVLSIAIAVAATVGFDRSEASQSAETVARTGGVPLGGPPLAREQMTPSESATDRSTPVESIAPDLALSLAEAAPPIAEDVAPPAATRRVGVAAIGQAAGPPAAGLSIEERRAAAIQRAAEREDEPEVVEPPFLVVLPRDPGLTASPPLASGDVIEATVSFYYCEQGDAADGGDGGGFCGPMRDGTVVYEGAAACAFTYLGQQFRIVGDPTQRIYTCHDTGSAVHGLHRDVFFYSAADGWPWLQTVGTRVMLEIVG